METTALEFWNDAWWRWYLKDGKPYAFVREELHTAEAGTVTVTPPPATATEETN